MMAMRSPRIGEKGDEWGRVCEGKRGGRGKERVCHRVY